MIRELFFSHRAVPTWIALTALFVALGGPSWAGELISGKKIPGNKIKKETITGKQVKNGTLTEVELSPATAAALRAVGPDSVTGASVADGSLGGADLGDGAVANSDLGPDAVETTKLQDGSLRGADVGRFSGVFTLDFGNINGGTCGSQTTASLTPTTGGGQDLNDDAIIVTPTASFPPTTLSLEAQPAGAAQIAVTICNRTGGVLAVGSRNFHYVAIDSLGE